MPISLIPTPRSRRAFLQIGAFATAAPWSALSQNERAAPWFALLADTHIHADPATEARGINMAANLKAVVAEILAEPTAPEFAFVNGDCAYNEGLKTDYATFRPLIQPLLDAGVPVHLTMGNHDDRAPFYELFPEAKNESQSPGGKHLSVIDSAQAHWFLIDTLQVVNKVTGEVGAEQRAWLSAEIDKLAGDGKPVVIVGHHNPQQLPEGSTERVTGLADTAEFMDLLRSKPQVKAYLFGHSHNYGFNKASGDIHLINQPPVAYLFDETRPNGWLRAGLQADSLTVELRALDKSHVEHGQQKTLAWR